VCARATQPTTNCHTNHDGERLDGRDAVQVAVQQRVAGADNADEVDEVDDEAFVQRHTVKTATATGGGVERLGWDGDLKKVRVNESRGSS
jgi:hypothetical protein